MPILDHCYQYRGETGVKAILLYPMNALATDQAKRIAQLIWNNPNLKGKVTAGLFVGEKEQHPNAVMTPDGVITDKDIFEKRQKKLPSSLVVCLVIAMSFWSSDAMATVLQNLVNGLSRQWTKLGQAWHSPISFSRTRSAAETGISGDDPIVSSYCGRTSHSRNPRSLSRTVKSDGGGWNGAGCA